ncbi:MAG: hypothetical protein ABJA49_14010 [Betaproteobacteria bacterium]
MTDITDITPRGDEQAQGLKSVGWLSYVLHLIVAIGAIIPGAQAGALLLVVALVIDLVKRPEAEGTWQSSHFSWRIHSVLLAGLMYLLTAPLFLLFILPGQLAWMLVSIWFLYRIVKGMVAMNADRAVGS